MENGLGPLPYALSLRRADQTLRTLGVGMRHLHAEAILILRTGEERTDHGVLRPYVVQRTVANLAQPEEKSANVRVPPQVTRILRIDKRPVVFGVQECLVVDAAI